MNKYLYLRDNNTKLLFDGFGFMLKTMNELDEIWQRMIQEAALRAGNSGNADVAEYLQLKATNDALRAAACRWLFDSFIELSDDANKLGIRLDVENENPYRYAVGRSTMVGALLCFRFGVRNLTIETGWTRTPSDGFMRGGSLAHARILHFGMSKANAELLLIRQNNDLPHWFLPGEDGGNRKPLSSDHLREHFKIFTGDL